MQTGIVLALRYDKKFVTLGDVWYVYHTLRLPEYYSAFAIRN